MPDDVSSQFDFLLIGQDDWNHSVTYHFPCHVSFLQPQPEKPAKPAPKPPRPPPLPTVDGESGQLDVVSRLLKDRILLLGTDVNDEVANVLVAQLLYLANQDPNRDITLYINSPGGTLRRDLFVHSVACFVGHFLIWYIIFLFLCCRFCFGRVGDF